MYSEDIFKSLEYSSRIYTPEALFCTGKTYVSKSGTEFCVNVDGGNVTIVFRGTDSKSEWASNLRFCGKKVPYGNYESAIRVHTGFIDTYNCDEVRKKIHSLIPEAPCRIIVTGHSRGAALAVLCAVDLQYNFPGKNVEAYLFGCPRVGNRAFSLSYNKRVSKTLRIENGNDIVTKLPPAIFGFRHVGARLHTGRPRLPIIFSFKAHYPTQYLQSVVNRLL